MEKDDKTVIYEFGKLIEWCPTCENPIELQYTFKAQRCNICSGDIIPCSLCDKYYIKEGCKDCTQNI